MDKSNLPGSPTLAAVVAAPIVAFPYRNALKSLNARREKTLIDRRGLASARGTVKSN